MMTLTIPGQQRWNEKTEEFVYTPAVVLKLEHSLLSLAHWESNWNIPFLSNLDKLTVEQWLDYIRCMTVTKGVDPEVYARLTREQYRSINEYMEAPDRNMVQRGAETQRTKDRRKAPAKTTATEKRDRNHGRGAVLPDVQLWHSERVREVAFEPVIDPDPGMPGEPGTGEEDEQGRPDGPAADAERAEKGPAEDERVRCQK